MDSKKKTTDYQLYDNDLINYYNTKKTTIKNQFWMYIKERSFAEQKLFLKHLLDDFTIEKKHFNLSYNEIIIKKLNELFSSITFELNNENFEDYNSVRKNNMRYFSNEEINIISKNEILNSLFYFDSVNFISSELINNRFNYS
jgi:hypothetical protein